MLQMEEPLMSSLNTEYFERCIASLLHFRDIFRNWEISRAYVVIREGNPEAE